MLSPFLIGLLSVLFGMLVHKYGTKAVAEIQKRLKYGTNAYGRMTYHRDQVRMHIDEAARHAPQVLQLMQEVEGSVEAAVEAEASVEAVMDMARRRAASQPRALLGPNDPPLIDPDNGPSIPSAPPRRNS